MGQVTAGAEARAATVCPNTHRSVCLSCGRPWAVRPERAAANPKRAQACQPLTRARSAERGGVGGRDGCPLGLQHLRVLDRAKWALAASPKIIRREKGPSMFENKALSFVLNSSNPTFLTL